MARPTISPQDLTALYAHIDALPPLTDEQVDALADRMRAASRRGPEQVHTLSPETIAAIDALPPLTDEQIEALGDALAAHSMRDSDG